MASEHRNSGIFEEDQLTPKPLRIKKRSSPAREEHEKPVTPSTPTINAENSALVCYNRAQATRRSSLISLINEICELAQCDYPDDNFEEYPTVSVAIAPSQPGPAALHVRKTRRSIAISGSSTDNSVARCSENGSSAARCTTMTQYPGPRDGHARADFNEARLLMLDTDNIMRQLSTPISTSRPFLRHVYRSNSCSARPSSDREDCINSAGVSKSSQRVLGRQSSFKLRFLNRLASGFDTMITAYNMADGDYRGSEEQWTHSGSFHSAQNRSGGDQDRIPAKLRCVTDPNPSLRPSFESDLESTIASFPSPPNSSFTAHSPLLTTQNPLNTTESSIERCFLAQLTQSDEMSSQNTGIVCARLTVMRDKEYVVASDLEGGVFLFVAIEVEGTVCTVSKDVDVSPEANPLDLAVVIDNSFYTSPAALMSACESVTAIANSLELETDRLTLFQTSPDPRDPRSSTNILPLRKPDLWSLKKVLDNVAVCAGKPEPDCLAATITQAQNRLISCPRADDLDNQGQEAIRQIVVITSRPYTVASTSCSEDRIGVHVMCDGSLPWKSEQPAIGDGWHIDHQPSSRDVSVACKVKDEERTANRLSNLMSKLRSSSAPGELSGLKVTFTPGRFCTVANVIGSTSFNSLRPGEIVKTFVKLHMSASNIDAAIMSGSSQGQQNSSSSQRLMAALADLVQEELLIPILTAKVEYTHSLLPEGTVCQVQFEASVKVVSSLHQEQNKSRVRKSASHFGDLNLEAVVLQKSVMYYVATTSTPACALDSFLRSFGKDIDSSMCPEYMMLLVAELKYQARVATRIDALDTNTSGGDYEGAAMKISSSKGSISTNANVPPTAWFHPFIDPFPENTARGPFNPSSELFELAANEPVRNTARDSFDPARLFLSNIRKASKSHITSFIGRTRTRRGTRATEEQKQTQELAARNEKSTGQDSLDSRVPETRGLENVAPIR
ncbi:hypothetical protein MMC18_003128 [Xylographa bjoerkii]|nr:hypothetical protein [Xylographa bjoerkii]